jgi:hypothetical protein
VASSVFGAAATSVPSQTYHRGIRRWMTLTPSTGTKYDQSLAFNASCMRCGSSITTENETHPQDNSPVVSWMKEHGDDPDHPGQAMCQKIIEQEKY